MIANLLFNLGWLQHIQGEYAAATTLLHESLALSRELGDTRPLAAALQQLGAIARTLGDHPRARTLLEESLALSREVGDRLRMADALTELGQVATAEHADARALALYAESLALLREVEDQRNLAALLERLAALWGTRGQGTVAAQIWGAAAAMRAAIGAPLGPGEQIIHEREVAAARTLSGEAAFAAAWAAGATLTLEQAVALALEDHAAGG